MATKNIVDTFKPYISWLFQSKHENTNADSSSNICYIFGLPPEILQTITEYLTIRDIVSLSRTCQTFQTLINDDNFWIHRIRFQFPTSITNLYTYDIFKEPDIIEINDEPRPSGFEHVRENGELDHVAKMSATHYNDEAIAKSHAKIYMSRENFLDYLQYFQYTQPRNIPNIPFMKLIYFYLIDRKRTSVVNMDVIHRNNNYLVETSDTQSLTGRIIELRSVCWLEITGHFEHKIMPGKYEAIWRMKCYEQYVRMLGEAEFSVVPSHGKMLIHKISDDDFRSYSREYGTEWFLINMGEIIVYEISTVFIGIRSWSNGFWKSGIAWDCIELKVVP